MEGGADNLTNTGLWPVIVGGVLLLLRTLLAASCTMLAGEPAASLFTLLLVSACLSKEAITRECRFPVLVSAMELSLKLLDVGRFGSTGLLNGVL